MSNDFEKDKINRTKRKAADSSTLTTASPMRIAALMIKSDLGASLTESRLASRAVSLFFSLIVFFPFSLTFTYIFIFPLTFTLTHSRSV